MAFLPVGGVRGSTMSHRVKSIVAVVAVGPHLP